MLDYSYTKQPDEQETVRVDFTNRISSFVVAGYTASTGTVTIYNSAGVSVNSTMLQGSASVSGNYIYFTIKAGTADTNYYAKVALTLTKTGSENQVIEEDLSIYVAQEGAA